MKTCKTTIARATYAHASSAVDKALANYDRAYIFGYPGSARAYNALNRARDKRDRAYAALSQPSPAR